MYNEYKVDDIISYTLKKDKKYSVKVDELKCTRAVCMLVQETKFCFIFARVEQTRLNHKICINKVDYFLDKNLIKLIDKNL